VAIPLAVCLWFWPLAPAEAGPGWERGFERLTYRVSWGYLSIGKAIIQARSPAPGRAELLSELCANGAVDSMYEDRDRFLAHSRFDGSRWQTDAFRTARDKEVAWDGRQYRLTPNGVAYIRDLKTGKTDYRPVPPGTLDALSALYAIRSRELESGASFTLPVLDRGEPFRLHAHVEGRERLETAMGSATPAIRVATYLEDEATGHHQRPLRLWFTADRRHLPLRLEAEAPLGEISLELREVGTTPVADPLAGLTCP